MRRLRLLLVFAVLATACTRPECGYEIVSTASSPDGRHVATLFVENCHATAPLVTVVNLRRADEAFDPDVVVFSASGKPTVVVSWRTNDEIVVIAERAEIYEQQSRWRGISVKYSLEVTVRLFHGVAT